jgi:pyruvate dehydrogenase E1 component alpha subunit
MVILATILLLAQPPCGEIMPPDLWALYALMLKSRLFEEIVTQLWKDGLISGEMHLGTGEEAIAAGVVSQLGPDDAMALDHRGTPPLLMRGVDPASILGELLGYPDGLCGGRGGHMHLFSKEHLAASSGIVGAAGPTGVGFALAAQYLRPGTIAVAFFGEGAMNQGMLLESLNLASVWKLPVVFVCKDDQWSITTRSSQVTGGSLRERVCGLGLPYIEADGLDVEKMWQAAQPAIQHARLGQGPSFLHARCVHLEGHFLGYQLLRAVREPLKEMPGIAIPLTRSFIRREGASLRERIDGLKGVISSTSITRHDPRQSPTNDPIVRARAVLMPETERLKALESSVEGEVAGILSAVLEGDAA